MRNPTPTRPGFTILELVVVLALLIILAAVTLPSFGGLKGNSDQRAAADVVRGRLADARGLAMQQGSAYRVAASPDGTRVRVAPDVMEFADLPASDVATASATAIDSKLDKATVGVQADADEGPVAPDPSGWTTVATFLPDGTCREDNVVVEVRDPTFPPIRIRIRGVTGSARVIPNTTANGGMR